MSCRTQIADLAAALVDFIYPPHCPACEGWQGPEDRDVLCASCCRALSAPLGARCRRCSAGLTNPAAVPASTRCPSCAQWPAVAFSRAVVMTEFTGPAQAAVHALKFGGMESVGHLLGRLMAGHPEVAPELRDIEALVPVPLHPSRRRERGFNQAQAVAEGIASVTGLPLVTDLVRRCRVTRRQARLDGAERLENLAGAFTQARAQASGAQAPEDVSGWRTVGLVDDVMTTGSTLSACAAALSTALPRAEIRAFAVAQPARRPPLT